MRATPPHPQRVFMQQRPNEAGRLPHARHGVRVTQVVDVECHRPVALGYCGRQIVEIVRWQRLAARASPDASEHVADVRVAVQQIERRAAAEPHAVGRQKAAQLPRRARQAVALEGIGAAFEQAGRVLAQLRVGIRPRPADATTSRRWSKSAPRGTPTVTVSGCRGMCQPSRMAPRYTQRWLYRHGCIG